ncbi:MAG: hypothetical protein JWN04_3016, partial [Myxococcaceae bacterium]|nr:hypothetical protein [Myxococcaceae bacterium]
FADYRSNTAPPLFATRDFFPSMLPPDLAILIGVAWLVARLCQRG